MTKARDLANASTALSAVSATELAFVDGVTSAIQTQLDAKATLTGTETLTNKTLTSPVLTTPTISTVNAKGDLLVGTADNTIDRLAVGNSGEQIVADSSTSTGLRYNPSYTAGKNFVINGNMDIWQRGTTVSFGSFDARYLADRWALFVATAGNTVSQETTTVPTGAQYALKWNSTGAGGSYGMYQVIETANTIPLAGRTVTLSASVTGTTGKTAYIQIATSTGVDNLVTGSWTAAGNSSLATLTSGTFSKLTITTTLGASVKTIRVAVISSDSFANTEYITFGSVQLEVGSVATQFSRAGGSIQGELAACQRYYYRYTAVQANTNFGVGMNQSTTAGNHYIKFPISLRTQPTSVDFSGLNISDYASYGAAITTLAIVGNASGVDTVNVVSGGASGMTTQLPSFLRATTAATSYIAFSAEL